MARRCIYLSAEVYVNFHHYYISLTAAVRPVYN
jgi:hypothetical protein